MAIRTGRHVRDPVRERTRTPPVMALFDTLAPLFGIIVLGFLAARMRVLDKAQVRGLVLFVFNFAIPVLLFRSLAQVELPESIEWGFLIAFYAGSLAVYGFGMAAGRFLFGRPLDEQAIFGMAAAFSNTVFLGIPIILTAFGPEATLPVFLIITFHSALFMPLTVGFVHLGRGERVSATGQLRTVFVELVKNPIVVGLFAGLAVNLAGLPIPTTLDRAAEILGGAAIPCALFAMGASLAAYPLVGRVGTSLTLSTFKLALHPLLVWVVAVPVLGLEGLWMKVAVLMAAMPAGVNVYLFGARYDAAQEVAARTVLLSSVLSLITVAALLAILG